MRFEITESDEGFIAALKFADEGSFIGLDKKYLHGLLSAFLDFLSL
jgi:hypothetical protein